MQDVLYAIVFMSLIFGLAAGILFVLDRLTLKKHSTAEEKAIIIAKRTERWQKSWALFQACCAVLALIVSIFNPDHDPPVLRLFWALVGLWFLYAFVSRFTGGGQTRHEDE